MTSKHYTNQRTNREKFIKECLGEGRIVDGFVVDRAHPMGAEVHSVTDNGIIIIHNLYSGLLVSKLIAREGQITRYYKYTEREPPEEYEKILELARLHESLGYNKI